jgi:hypothetical protein
LSIFVLAHRHVNHSIVLLITIFHYVHHVLISTNVGRGPSMVSSLVYSNGFVCHFTDLI